MPEFLQGPNFSNFITLGLAAALLVGLNIFLRKMTSVAVKDGALRYRLRKFVTFLTAVIFILIAMTVFSERLTGVTVALGVAGAGIAFALQEVIASIAGWVAISVSSFYNVGDRVMLGGITGDVIDISTLRTTLMETGQWVRGDLYNGRIVRVSNAFVFKEPVFNYSGDFPFLWDEITVPIKYGSDRSAARSIMEQAGQDILSDYAKKSRDSWRKMVVKYMIEDAVLDPTVTITANDNWMEFTLRYVVDYKMRRSTKDKLFTKILDEIDNSGGRVQIASATLQVVTVPELTVGLRGNEGREGG